MLDLISFPGEYLTLYMIFTLLHLYLIISIIYSSLHNLLIWYER